MTSNASLQGVIDLHVHTMPDVRPRRHDDVAQAKLARAVGAAAIVLKSHQFPTVDRAYHTQALVPEIGVFGGLVLNSAVGGINPAAVQVACRQGARLIWMPTLDARNHRRCEGSNDGIDVVVGGRLVPAVREVLRIIADHDVALATGHLSPAETRVVVEAAITAGVRRIIVNHPEHRIVAMSIDDQRALARDFPVFFERCYAQPIGDGSYKANHAVNLAAIRAVGVATTVLATDSGQLESAPWDDALRETTSYLLNHGLSVPELDHMMRAAPAYLCGLASERPDFPVPPIGDRAWGTATHQPTSGA